MNRGTGDPALPTSLPHRGASRFVDAAGQRWHVQRLGQGPAVLLLHGTGASTHSWAGLIGELAGEFELVAVDLPGHGLSEMGSPEAMSLPGMAERLGGLLEALDLHPALAVGHSAGAAVLARMGLDGLTAPAGLVSINGALLPLHGLPGRFFTGAARLLAELPAVPHWVARRSARGRFVEKLIRQTGSNLDAEDIEHYRHLVGSPDHVAAALQMMARWDLRSLERELGSLAVPLYLVACTNDQAVPVAQARRLAERLPAARLRLVPGVGHLGHEEDAAGFAALLREIAGELGILSR